MLDDTNLFFAFRYFKFADAGFFDQIDEFFKFTQIHEIFSF